MNKNEVITGLNSLRFEAEKAEDEYGAEIIFSFGGSQKLARQSVGDFYPPQSMSC